jgi:hypothetical protein
MSIFRSGSCGAVDRSGFPDQWITETIGQSPRRLATLAALPGKKSSFITSTTGTGASGEIRADFAPDTRRASDHQLREFAARSPVENGGAFKSIGGDARWSAERIYWR